LPVSTVSIVFKFQTLEPSSAFAVFHRFVFSDAVNVLEFLYESPLSVFFKVFPVAVFLVFLINVVGKLSEILHLVVCVVPELYLLPYELIDRVASTVETGSFLLWISVVGESSLFL